MITYQRFLELCDKALKEKCSLGREDLADCVDPANYWDSDMSETEAMESARDFAEELLEAEGFPTE